MATVLKLKPLVKDTTEILEFVLQVMQKKMGNSMMCIINLFPSCFDFQKCFLLPYENVGKAGFPTQA